MYLHVWKKRLLLVLLIHSLKTWYIRKLCVQIVEWSNQDFPAKTTYKATCMCKTKLGENKPMHYYMGAIIHAYFNNESNKNGGKSARSYHNRESSRPGAKTIKKNTNSTQNKSQTHRAKQYKVTAFLSTDCELSTETCSKNVHSLGPWLCTVHVVSLTAHVKYNSFPEIHWLMSCMWAHVFTWLIYTARQWKDRPHLWHW